MLVSYAGYPYTLSSLFPDNGLASLAAVLRTEGHECEVLDLNTVELIDRMVDRASRSALGEILRHMAASPDPDTMRRLVAVAGRVEQQGRQVADEIARALVQRCRERRPDFVGFKLWNGDGFEASLRIARHIRDELPAIRLYAGGPSVHYCADLVAREAPVFDAVIDGDGEQAILELARHAEGRRSLEGIPNLVTGQASSATAVEDLSCLPLPDYSKEAYPSVHDGSKLRLFCIDDSRGCPMRCAFCINWRIEGTRWRTRTADQVVQEVEGFRELGSRAFRLAGTYSPPKLVGQICDRLIEKRLDVEFGVSLHANGARADLAAKLREAGCFGVFIGVESAAAAILDRAVGKSVSPQQLREALQACMDTGLFTAGSFIFPAPFETEETEAETRALIRELFAGNPRSTINLCFAGLLPRTTWWAERERFGFELQVSEEEYLRRMLRYKIRHLVPTTYWEPLPYTLDGTPQPELARRTDGLQRWARSIGVGVNLPDHDAQVGVSLGHTAVAFQGILRRNLFTGDAKSMHQLVSEANRALSP